MKNKILVIGGTGKTGRKVAEKLQNLNHEVRIGSRKATPAFDWEKPETWAETLTDIEKVYITFQPDLAVPGAEEAIARLSREAKKQGVKKLVLLSGKGEREAARCEQVVVDSGLDYTIIRASWFMQNFSESFFLDPILAGHVALPKAEVKIPFVDTGDIADVVVESLLNEVHNGHSYEVTGPEAISFRDIVEEISDATGRELTFTEVSMDSYINMLKEVGIPEDYIWLINYLFTEVLDAAGNNEISEDVEKVLGRKSRNFADYARETAHTGVWNVPVESEG